MSRSPDRCSTLERGSPETEPRSCGSQSAHESLFNRRLRVLSPAVRTYQPTPSAAAETKNCVRTLESEHESRALSRYPMTCEPKRQEFSATPDADRRRQTRTRRLLAARSSSAMQTETR